MQTKTRILIVDDDPHVRKTLSDILKVKGYETVAAKDGDEGIAEAQREFVNLALIDLMLPGLSGIEVMEHIKAFSASTEAIILTGNASVGTAIEATNKGAFSYLLKPYSMEDLLLHIRRAIERQHAQETVDQLRRQLELIVQSTGDGIFTLDTDGNLLLVNPAAARMLGYEAHELIGRHSHDAWQHSRADGTPYPEQDSPIYQTLQDGQIRRRDEEVFWRKDGTSFCVEYVCAPIRGDRDISGVVVTFLDITERKSMEKEIHAFATTDSLTGIANRRVFAQALDTEVVRARRYGTPLALIMYDIDHFKQVNDTFGHDVGDEVLKGITGLVTANKRAADMLARWGGEEFMILVPQCDLEHACALAEKLRAAVAARIFEKAGLVTASFGVAVFGPDDDPAVLLKNVDNALYRAKQLGRNRVETDIGQPASVHST